jgi:hypothetical protein
MVQDQFVALKLHHGIGVDVGSGSAEFNARHRVLGSFDEIVGKQRYRRGSGIPVDENTRTTATQDCRCSLIGGKRHRESDGHGNAHEMAPSQQNLPNCSAQTAELSLASEFGFDY